MTPLRLSTVVALITVLVLALSGSTARAELNTSKSQAATTASKDKQVKSTTASADTDEASADSDQPANLADETVAPEPQPTSTALASQATKQRSTDSSTPRSRGPPAITAEQERSIAKANAAAARPRGACGGGYTLNQAISGWKGKGVLDDVARDVGQKPGLDGTAESIIRKGMVKTIVVKGGYVTNYTCKGGKFVKVAAKKYIPKGAIYWVPERFAPKCKPGKTSATDTAKRGYQDNCGNKQLGKLRVKRQCPKPKPKPETKPKPCNCPAPTIGSGNDQDNKQTIGKEACDGNHNSSNTTGNGNVTGNCNQVNQICVGNNVCNNTPPPCGGCQPTPTPTPTPPPCNPCNPCNPCPTPTPTPTPTVTPTPTPTVTPTPTPTPPPNNPPIVTTESGPHLYAPNPETGNGGEVAFYYFQTHDPDGDAVAADIDVVSGDEYADWNSLKGDSTYKSGAPCASGWKCWRFTIWAVKSQSATQAGLFVYRVKVMSKGFTIYSTNQTVRIMPYEFEEKYGGANATRPPSLQSEDTGRIMYDEDGHWYHLVA